MAQGTFVDLTGMTFARWTVSEYAGRSDSGRESIWLCTCSCGAEKVVTYKSLVKGRSKSCGCLKREKMTRHGMSQIGSTYSIWYNMNQRCLNKSNPAYKNYGGRGITICDRWQGENGIVHFIEDMGMRPDGLTIDRIDNESGYAPDNCRWATYSEQNKNKRKRSTATVGN